MTLPKLQALVYDILPSTTAVFSYAIGSRKLSANKQFFCWCSNSSKFVTNNSNYIRHLFNVAMLFTPAQIKPKSFESTQNLFFTRGGCVSCLHVCLGARLLPQSYQYPNLSEGTDRVGGQLRGDKECPFICVTKSGRIWRMEPESDAPSVDTPPTACPATIPVQWLFSKCSHTDIRHKHTQFDY